MRLRIGDVVRDKFKRPKGLEDESVCRGIVIGWKGDQIIVQWEVANAQGEYIRTVNEHILEKL